MLEPGARSGDDFRMVGEAEIVVGAEVQHLAAALDADFRSLGALDDALALEETLAVKGLGLLLQVVQIRPRFHGAAPIARRPGPQVPSRAPPPSRVERHPYETEMVEQ